MDRLGHRAGEVADRARPDVPAARPHPHADVQSSATSARATRRRARRAGARPPLALPRDGRRPARRRRDARRRRRLVRARGRSAPRSWPEFTPIPMHAGAPSDVPRDEAANRFLRLYFVDDDLPDRVGRALRRTSARTSPRRASATLVFVSPFRATVPGHRHVHRPALVSHRHALARAAEDLTTRQVRGYPDGMEDFPKIISVDDHVIEPPNVWQDRLPGEVQGRRPASSSGARSRHDLRRRRVQLREAGDDEDGHVVRLVALRGPARPADPALGRGRAIDRDEITVSRHHATTTCARGCWDPKARLEDMDVNHVEASLALPDLPALLRPDVHRGARTRSSPTSACKAYNDWMVDEWCGGSDGRLIPLIIIQLWDAELAAAEVRRNAARGVHAVVLQRDPAVPRPAVDPRRTATGTRSSRRARRPSTVVVHAHRLVVEDAVDVGRRAAGRRLDAHVHERDDVAGRLADVGRASSASRTCRSPTARARSAGSRTSSSAPTRCGRTTGAGAASPTRCPAAVRATTTEHVYGCFFDDAHGLDSLDEVGVDNVTFETDYPHSDSTWPHTKEVADEADGPPRRRDDPQARARQRHPHGLDFEPCRPPTSRSPTGCAVVSPASSGRGAS